MKRATRALALTASALATTVMVGGANVSAGDEPVTAVECSESRDNAERLVNGGTKVAGTGITIPEGAIVTSIVVTTEDDYNSIGRPFGGRTAANQNDETVVILIGGVQVGGKTDDLPDDASADVKTTKTTTVFTGEVKASGAVTIQHVGNSSSPNSVVAKTVTVNWYIPGFDCQGGTYPPKTVTVAPVTGSTSETTTEVIESKPTVVTKVVPVEVPVVETPVVVVPAIVPPADKQSSSILPDVVTKPVTTPAATGTATQVLSGTVTAPAATVGSAASASSAAGGTLPVTGSESIDTLQLAAAAGAAGLGMLVVSRLRRRSNSLRAS